MSYQIMPGRLYWVTVQPLLRYRELSEAKSADVSDRAHFLKTATSNRIEVTPQESTEPHPMPQVAADATLPSAAPRSTARFRRRC